MTKPGVWAVSMSQLLDWMENPVPAAAVSGCWARVPQLDWLFYLACEGLHRRTTRDNTCKMLR